MNIRLIAVLLALVVVAAACGGSDGTATAPVAAEPEPVATESAAADATDPDAAAPDVGASITDLLGDCAAFPSFSEGSYYVEPGGDRTDLVEPGADAARLGLPLAIRLIVVEADTCVPFADQPVELWGAAADGRYSGVATQPDGTDDPTLQETWLRGRHVTDADGVVEFTTVVPGWIPGQAPHLHVSTAIDERRSFTARIVLPDERTDTIYADGVYADRGAASVTVANEIARDPGIERSVIALTPTDDGFRADVVLAIADIELREPPVPVLVTTETPSDGADDVLIEEPTRNFDQLGGELQEMFNRAGADLGIEPELIYAEFRFVTSDEPPNLPAIAERLGVTEEALALALPLLAGGAPAPAE